MSFLSRLLNLNAQEKESDDYFFHYTNQIDHLISILNNYFMPFYCMESIEYLNLTKSSVKGMAYPVVCFCDLPLNRQKNHKAKFGAYGIGLKKEWGIKNLLSPVVYSHPRSMTSASLRILINMGNQLKANTTEEEFRKFNNAVSLLLMLNKAYEGKLYMKDIRIFAEKTSRFYDEREWRYIPLNVDGLKLNLEMDEYQNNVILDKENKLIQKNNKLKFVLDDVEYLFLKNKDEIEHFLSKLSPEYSKDEKKEIKKKIHFN